MVEEGGVDVAVWCAQWMCSSRMSDVYEQRPNIKSLRYHRKARSGTKHMYTEFVSYYYKCVSPGE
jgi:hypothetical protein